MPRSVRLALPALAVAAAAALAATGGAQEAAAPVADDPATPLVYVFSVDGLDGDRVDQGRAPFLSRLLLGQEDNRATYYRESRSVMVAETNPNHAAMATGAFGESSGIPGNAFAVYGPTAKRDCAGQSEGESNTPGQPANETAGEPATTNGERAGCLLAETMFATVKRLPNPDGITTSAIFGKPKLARIFEGRTVNPQELDVDHLWAPCESRSSSNPDYCRPVPVNPVTDYALDDGVVMDEVLRSVREGVPARGAQRRPNLTFVNLPQVDSAGHAAGAREAYDTAIAQADQQLQRFVAQQKALGLWERTTMLVVSDHSMDTTLAKTSLEQRFRTAGVSGGYSVVQNGSVDMVYLADRTSPQRFELLRRLRAAALGGSGNDVDEALYREPNPADGGDRHTLDAVHPGWRIAGPRTGDLFVTHKLGGAFSDPINPLTGNHGSPMTSDNTFAIIGGGTQTVRQQAIGGRRAERFDDTLLNPGQAQNVDVAPTVLALLGRPAPAQSQGRVLTEAFEPAALRAAQQAGVLSTDGAGRPAGTQCAIPTGFRSVSVRPRGRGLRVAFARRTTNPVQVDVFQQSRGREVLGMRLVARFAGRRGGFTWSGRPTAGRRISDGQFFVRVRVRTPEGRVDDRRFPLRRTGGRFAARPAFTRTPRCDLVLDAKLERTVFGGRGNRALFASFRLDRAARVSVDVLRGGRVVRRFAARERRGAITHRIRIPSERLGRGDHVVRITAVAGDRRRVVRLTARRL
jgi:predicted AlkP superfamily pyrophosphatase or phosphodiesterase